MILAIMVAGYLLGCLPAGYLVYRFDWPSEDFKPLAIIWWPALVALAPSFLGVCAVLLPVIYLGESIKTMAIRHREGRPKRVIGRTVSPPCRCNGGTEPCQLPPAEGVYR